MNTLRVRIKPYIQPFERVLALRELRVLSASEPRHLGLLEETSTEFEVASAQSSSELAARLSYWEAVEYASASTLTTQILRESTVNVSRNDFSVDAMHRQPPFTGQVSLPNRRCLRYGTHGIHEYRGKFFPQLVRSLINIAATPSGAIIADPMSGSGTTIVEAVLANCQGMGLDMNPLSVFVGTTKAKLLSADVTLLVGCYEQIRKELTSTSIRKKRPVSYFDSLHKSDREYLSSWFSPDVLSSLDDISVSIQRARDGCAQDLMRVSLSNILRRVSWQKDDDLRVRKDVRSSIEINPKYEFLKELDRSIRAITAFLVQNGRVKNSRFTMVEGDARSCSSRWGANSLDLVITSPPYATALPYLDTDRLSLCYLGLLQRPEHRDRDKQMIGNREVSERLRREYWERFENSSGSLPRSVSDLIRKIELLNSANKVGFRRRNLPALLANYFFDMTEVINGIRDALKPGRYAFLVVGDNHTFAGGQRVEIRTSQLLQDLARSVGFNVAESLSMDMLVSRNIFKKNAVVSEEILAFRKPT